MYNLYYHLPCVLQNLNMYVFKVMESKHIKPVLTSTQLQPFWSAQNQVMRLVKGFDVFQGGVLLLADTLVKGSLYKRIKMCVLHMKTYKETQTY